MIIVLYDGKCGLCAKEISHYKKIVPDGIFEWQDITKTTDVLDNEGISLVDGLKSLHVKDNHDKMYSGVDAFIIIWSHIPMRHWKLLAYFVSLPIINSVARILYKKFAQWRFNNLSHCKIAQQQENSL